jgi:hypothetical protein
VYWRETAQSTVQWPTLRNILRDRQLITCRPLVLMLGSSAAVPLLLYDSMEGTSERTGTNFKFVISVSGEALHCVQSMSQFVTLLKTFQGECICIPDIMLIRVTWQTCVPHSYITLCDRFTGYLDLLSHGFE